MQKLDRLATQTIFAVLDHLFKWTRRKQNLMMAKARPGADPVKARSADAEYVQVESFLEAISQRRLAAASFHCGAYARSLLHWERHLSARPSELQAYLNYTLSSTRWRLSRQQTACLSLWPDGQLHDNCAPSIGVFHPLRV